jgi:hypothetical protein
MIVWVYHQKVNGERHVAVKSQVTKINLCGRQSGGVTAVRTRDLSFDVGQ